MVIHQPHPTTATERYFFFDNAAPQTGKRSSPYFTAPSSSSSWQHHAHHPSSGSSDKYQESGTTKPPAFASPQSNMVSEPAYKKARVVSDDELEEPNNTMNLARVKRALQQLEQADGSPKRTKRARLEVPEAAVAGPLPPEQETRIVLRDPNRPPRDLDVQDAERAIFNSLLLQRISNRYGSAASFQNMDLIDCRLQELIRGSMCKAIGWSDDDGACATTTAIETLETDDVAMEDDGSPED